MVLTAASCSPRSTGLASLRRPPGITGKLDPSVGGTGPHDLAVRTASHVWRCVASIASRANENVTTANRPSYRAGCLMNNRTSGKWKRNFNVKAEFTEPIESSSKFSSRSVDVGRQTTIPCAFQRRIGARSALRTVASTTTAIFP